MPFIAKLSDGLVPPIIDMVHYNNPRLTTYFAAALNNPRFLGGGSELWLTRNEITRGEFSPSYDGPPGGPPVGNGWRGQADDVLQYDGVDPIDVRIDMSINVGRQAPVEVDAELYIAIDGVEVAGAVQSGSINRAPVGGQGSSLLTMTVFAYILPGQTIACKLRRIGGGAAFTVPVNVYGAFINVSAMSTDQLPVQIIP